MAKDRLVGRLDCIECEGLGLTYCGFCKVGIHEGELCPMCEGQNVVDCFCSPDTDDDCIPLDYGVD